MDELYIAEKPGVGRAIAENLGGPVSAVRGNGGATHLVVGSKVVTWVFGHILELAEPEDYSDVFKGSWSDGEAHLPIIPDVWKLNVVSKAKEQMAVIRGLLKQAKKVVHAGDPDREGQLIIDEVLEYLKNDKPVMRILPNAIDNTSMKNILKDVRDNKDFRPMYESGLGRQRADWLVGMNMTRACTISNSKSGMRGLLSVGRVQTPTLAMVVRRDLEIENFKPADYFDPKARFRHPKGEFIGTWKPAENQKGMDSEKRLVDPAVAQAIEAACRAKPGKVTEYKVEDRKQQAPLPFSLSALQIKASSAFKMSAQTVLDTCQSLYERHKVTTYPRSDCQYLPEEQHGGSKDVLDAIAKYDRSVADLVKDANPAFKSRAWDTKKVTAHHAIIPTANPNYSALTEPEKKIFGLIVKQYLAQFYPDFTFKQTSVLTECGGYEFKASGRTPVGMGWRKVFGAEVDEDEREKDKDQQQILPPMMRGESVECVTVKSDRKQTKAPKRYTEGTLIQGMTNVHDTVVDPVMKKKLEAVKGIGTEATRGEIIKKLKARHFLVEEKGAIISTRVGREFIAVLPKELTDVALTALWENALDQIQSGKMPLDKFIDGQSQWLRKLTKQALEKEMCIALGFGNAEVNQATVAAVKEQSGKSCPSCGKGQLRMMQASKGENAGHYFLGCSNYPDCKHTVPIEGQEAVRGKSRSGSGGRKKTTTRRGQKDAED